MGALIGYAIDVISLYQMALFLKKSYGKTVIYSVVEPVGFYMLYLGGKNDICINFNKYGLCYCSNSGVNSLYFTYYISRVK